jgi:hypothetical protein
MSLPFLRIRSHLASAGHHAIHKCKKGTMA